MEPWICGMMNLKETMMCRSLSTFIQESNRWSVDTRQYNFSNQEIQHANKLILLSGIGWLTLKHRYFTAPFGMLQLYRSVSFVNVIVSLKNSYILFNISNNMHGQDKSKMLILLLKPCPKFRTKSYILKKLYCLFCPILWTQCIFWVMLFLFKVKTKLDSAFGFYFTVNTYLCLQQHHNPSDNAAVQLFIICMVTLQGIAIGLQALRYL